MSLKKKKKWNDQLKYKIGFFILKYKEIISKHATHSHFINDIELFNFFMNTAIAYVEWNEMSNPLYLKPQFQEMPDLQ